MRLDGPRGVTARSVLLLVLFGAGLSFFGCSRREDPKNPVLARIGDTEIRKWDFVSAVEKAPRDTWSPLDSLDHAGRLEFLKTMVAKELLGREADRRFSKLPPDAEYIVTRFSRDLALGLLASALAPPRGRLSSEEMEECRRRISRIYQTHTLVLDNEARAKEVAAGSWTVETFNDLVRRETLEMALNEMMATNFLREASVAQFIPDAIPLLDDVREGQIIGPLRMQKGWVVYRINAIVIPPDSILADTTGLADACRKIRAGIDLWGATNRLLEQAAVRYDDANLAWLQKRYSENFIAVRDSLGRGFMRNKPALIPRLTDADRARELAGVAGAPYTVGDLFDEMAARPLADFPNVQHRGSIRLLTEEVVLERVLLAEAEKRGITKRREVVQAVAAKRHDVALSYLLNRDLFEQAGQRVTEEQVQKFYQENIAEYMNRGKIQMALLYVSDFNRGKEYVLLLKRGEPFAKVAAGARREDPSAEYIPKSEFFDSLTNRELYDLGRELDKGTATGPIRMQDGRILVYQLLDRTAPEAYPLELVRPQVLESVTFLERERLLDELIPQLEKTYAVQIHEDKL